MRNFQNTFETRIYQYFFNLHDCTFNNIPLFKAKHIFFRNSFFTSNAIEWNNLDLKKINSETFSTVKKTILKFIRPSWNSIFYCHSPNGIKLITRLKLGFSHFREHKFRHNFQDTFNPICSYGDDIETTIHYLLPCPNYLDEIRALLDNLQNIGENIHDKYDFQISELLLFGVSLNNVCVKYMYFDCYHPKPIGY